MKKTVLFFVTMFLGLGIIHAKTLTIDEVIKESKTFLKDEYDVDEEELDKLIIIDSNNNKIDFYEEDELITSFNYTDNYIEYDKRDIIITEDNALLTTLDEFYLGIIMRSIFNLSGFENYSIKDDDIDFTNTYDNYGLQMESEEFSFDDDNSKLSGTTIKYLKISLDSDKISKLIEKYGIVMEKDSDEVDDAWLDFKKEYNKLTNNYSKKLNNVTISISNEEYTGMLEGDQYLSVCFNLEWDSGSGNGCEVFYYHDGVVSLKTAVNASLEQSHIFEAKDYLYDSYFEKAAMEIAIQTLSKIKSYNADDVISYINNNDGKLNLSKDGANYETVKHTVSISKDDWIESLNSLNLINTFELNIKTGIAYFNDINNSTKESENNSSNNEKSASTNICKKVDGVFYDKNGNIVDKVEYEKSCPESVPDTGMSIPTLAIFSLVIGLTISRKHKILNKI